MKGPLVWVGLLCLAPLCLALSYQEDDLVFDDVGEETPTLNTEASTESPSAEKPAKKHKRVEKLLGLPDAVAATGHVFKLHVPKQAFTGNINFYEASGVNGRGLPHWLRWDEPASALYGVPSRKDIGRHRVNIKAYGKHGDVAQDSFFIHVVPEKNEHFKHKDGKKRCTEEQDRTMLTLLVDARYENLKPSAKVNALENLAGFLGLHTNSISIQPDASKDSLDSAAGTSVVLSGPGNVVRRHEKHSTLVQWQVGCDGHFWPHQIDMIKQIPEQARDGTLSEVTQLPVYQWRVRSDTNDYSRNRRDTAGSGDRDDFLPDGDEEDDAEYDEGEDADYDEDYDGNEGVTETPQEPKQKAVVQPLGGNAVEHPHRHHHGEDSVAGINSGSYDEDDDFIWRNREINNALFNATSPTTTTSTTPSTTIAAILPSSTTTSTTTTTTTTTTEPPTTSSTTTEWTTTSTTSTTTEEPSSPSENTTTSTTTSTTAQAIASATAEILTITETTTSTYPNLTLIVTGTSNSSANATIDSLTIDGEETLPTEREIDAEIDEDETTITTQEPSVFVASEATTSSSGQFTGQSVVEVAATLEPNATSVLTVNASTEEYEEGQAPGREDTISSSTSGYATSWGDNSTEKIPGESLDPYETMHVPVFSSTTSTTTSTTIPSTTTTSTEPPTPSTTPTTTSTTTPSTTTSTTTEPTTPSTTTTTTTTTTTPAPTTSSTTLSTTTTTATERYGILRNSKPEVRRRLKKLAVMQGKVLTYTIPDDTFSDLEDGNTRQLHLRLYDGGAPIKPTYWLQFNERTHEVYGLPLEHDIGSYAFEVVAMDSEGATTNVGLDVAVQQYKQIRAVNHEFHIYLKIEKRSEFPTNVDWELKVMRNLAELYGDHDLSYITVRSIDIDDNQAIFSWTNDSLVRSSVCPQGEIDRLYNYLVADENREYPSDELIRVLGPEIKPKRVVYEGLEQCQQIKETQSNSYPVPRNQIDQLNATEGQLFIFRVPKDTFFDSEDGDTRNLKASVLTGNRTELPSWDWLQFDSRNQEFYGVPLVQDIGYKTYQLVVTDKGGLQATDSLHATVYPAPVVRHPVEILMKLSMPYDTFVHSAQKKREFIEKLQKLYGDRNSSAISLLSITGNRDATVVTWRNLSLPTNECPQDEIMRLFRVLVKDDKNFTDELYREFNSNIHQPEFNVMQISVEQTGACKDHAGAGGPQVPTIDDSTTVGASHDDYLITFVLPAIIIAAMLTLAGIIACILYKRRRSGKMSVSEKDDERQSFRSKGIPVIFQDELDEKPDPGNKSPIILKEEKPPLPPPEYQRAEDGADIPMLSKENSEEPYQPPPPFATNRDSNRQNRPKPTPTYRKPPPYVPP